MISKWAFTQARAETACPKCGVPVGDDCRTPSGRKAVYPHTARMGEYRKQIGVEEWNRRHTITALNALTMQPIIK